jgi:hypothetical protein
MLAKSGEPDDAAQYIKRREEVMNLSIPRRGLLAGGLARGYGRD